MKRLNFLLIFFGLLIAVLLSACGNAEVRESENAGNGAYILTVDGYGVTDQEFLLFLGDQKAATVNYFWTQHQVQPDADFWTTAVDGEKPLDYAKERAIDALVRAKIELILAAERGLRPYKDYDALMEEMASVNAERAEKVKNGEVYYGLTEFTPFIYYQYLGSNVRSELESAQRGLSKPSEAELLQIYEENRESFSLGTVYEYDVDYSDGKCESISQNNREIAKEDYTTESLLLQFDSMAEDETIEGYNYHGSKVSITYRGKYHQGYTSFENATDSLTAMYARQELSALMESRVDAAEVEITDQARFDALEMR